MRPLRLTRRMALEELSRQPDGAGGYGESWAALGVLWAEVVARTGRERAVGPASVSDVPYRITVRAAAPGAPSRPRPDQRLREGTRLFRIVAVTERDAAGHFLTCFAHEEAAA
ncbi:head-tail adaptor protein [Acidimangrovimonas pyrenivorans]|uniref:Head-tail adaptor protein n=1 Tax=Acidimangrovimonas pyrenivorans TaxID=2030798 RepID=A0ABV7AER9_9RHOB